MSLEVCVKGDDGGDVGKVEGGVKNRGHVWATGHRLVTPVWTLDVSKITTRPGCRWTREP